MNPNHRKHALAVLTTPRLQADRNDLAALQSVAVQQLGAISYIEKRAAVCAILAGITLWRVKATLPHGEFIPWIKSLSDESPAAKPAPRRVNLAEPPRPKCSPASEHLPAETGSGEARFEPVKRTQAHYYMRLAAAFVEKTRLDERAVLAARPSVSRRSSRPSSATAASPISW
jgi:hypothetical protein